MALFKYNNHFTWEINMLDLSHKRLIVWNKSIELVKEVYRLTSIFPEKEKFSLTSQLRRASVSVISNFSEGAARFSTSEKKRFFEIARSSLVEIDAQIEVAIALKIIKEKELNILSELVNEVFAILSKLYSNCYSS